MNKEGSYQFENLESRQAEATLLAERARMRLDGFIPLLQRHGFPEHGRALEVGCGHGLRTRLMAEHFPHVEVIGIDRSPELLSTSSSSSSNSSSSGFGNLCFQHADLYELSFASGSFDFVYARLVFMHLTDPTRALASLLRVLKPGGRILIEDADRDCMFFEPAPKSFAEFWRKVQEGQRRLGGDPNVGRKLAVYLKDSGFEAVQTEAQPIIGSGEEIAFLVRTLLPSLNTYLDPHDRAAGSAAIRDLAQLALDPRAVLYHFWFAVGGRKPG